MLQDLSRTRAPQASGVPCSNGIAPGGENHTPNMCWENADNFVGLPHGSSRDREFAVHKRGYIEFFFGATSAISVLLWLLDGHTSCIRPVGLPHEFRCPLEVWSRRSQTVTCGSWITNAQYGTRSVSIPIRPSRRSSSLGCHIACPMPLVCSDGQPS